MSTTGSAGPAPDGVVVEEPGGEAGASELALDAEVRAAQERLRNTAKRLGAAATALGPLARDKAYEDLKKLGAALDKVEAKIPEALREEAGLAGLLGRIRAWRDEGAERLRRRLGRELQAACAEAGLEFRVVSRAPPIEVRIPPLAVVIDFEKGLAELRFARLEVGRAAADARAILAAREKALKALGASFDPARFFQRCHSAWRAARAAKGENGERVEILDFLPYLALEMQGPRFRVDPTDKNFKGYGRARFAWDVLRIRRARMLARDGLRINFGVATGTTASQKKRVIYFEDEDGNGEYKLTIFFTREEGPAR